MTKSSFAAALLAIALPGAATAAEPMTAERALEKYHQTFTPLKSVKCEPGSRDDEVIVCAQRPQQRDVFPSAPGQRVALIPGEPASQREALRVDSSTCTAVGPNPRCSGGLNVFVVAGVLAKVAKHLIDPDD